MYGRVPTPQEVASSLAFVNNWQRAGTSAVSNSPVWQYGYGEYDAGSRSLKNFTPLPHFTGQNWQGGPQLPDPNVGWVLLTSTGGHPGDNLHCAVRRWTAPYDMTVSVRGKLEHPIEAGNGVEGMVISSRTGQLGSWTAHKSSADTGLAGIHVRRGDTLDFIVSSRGDVNSDGFQWAPTLDAAATVTGARPAETHWDATADFSGPIKGESAQVTTAWEAYAQALLLTNEFLFID